MRDICVVTVCRNDRLLNRRYHTKCKEREAKDARGKPGIAIEARTNITATKKEKKTKKKKWMKKKHDE
jgi:hypothetical protein